MIATILQFVLSSKVFRSPFADSNKLISFRKRQSTGHPQLPAHYANFANYALRLLGCKFFWIQTLELNQLNHQWFWTHQFRLKTAWNNDSSACFIQRSTEIKCEACKYTVCTLYMMTACVRCHAVGDYTTQFVPRTVRIVLWQNFCHVYR